MLAMTHHDDEHTLLLCSAAAGCCNQLQWLRVAESMVERRWTIHLSIAAVTVKLTHVNWKVLALPSWARALLRCFSYSFTDTCRNKTGMHAGQQLRRLPQHKVVGKESLLANDAQERGEEDARLLQGDLACSAVGVRRQYISHARSVGWGQRIVPSTQRAR